ncbi:hypothetical protein SAMN05428981_102361 [Bacillus sp. OV194]|nr:hypothetical protein SAMN05428981_102361 [Bacillus sp. OV194]
MKKKASVTISLVLSFFLVMEPSLAVDPSFIHSRTIWN